LIIISTGTDAWSLRKNIIWKEGIAAAMAAVIAPMIMKRWLNQNAANYAKKRKNKNDQTIRQSG
jgi:hypothetical protein